MENPQNTRLLISIERETHLKSTGGGGWGLVSYTLNNDPDVAEDQGNNSYTGNYPRMKTNTPSSPECLNVII